MKKKYKNDQWLINHTLFLTNLEMAAYLVFVRLRNALNCNIGLFPAANST